MKNIILILITSFALFKGYGQSKDSTSYELAGYTTLWNKQIGDTAYIFANVAYIRDEPTLKSNIIDSLNNGKPVIIKSEAYNYTMVRGFEAPWQKISYTKDNKVLEGYIWIGLLNIGSVLNDDGQLFLYGFLRCNNSPNLYNRTYILEVKCFDNNGKILDQISYPIQLSEQSFSESKMLSNMGLQNLKAIYRIGFLGEACAVPSLHYYFTWNGKRLNYLLHKFNVSDAAVYYYSENVLFPSEHKLSSDLIIKDIEQGEVIDETADELEYKVINKREKFIWNGYILSPKKDIK